MNPNNTSLNLDRPLHLFNGEIDNAKFEKRLSALRGTPDEDLLFRCPQLNEFLPRAITHLRGTYPRNDENFESVAHYLMGKGVRLPNGLAPSNPDLPQGVKKVLCELLRTHRYSTLKEDSGKTFSKLQALTKHLRAPARIQHLDLIEEPEEARKALFGWQMLDPDELHRSVLEGAKNIRGIQAAEQRCEAFGELLRNAKYLQDPQQCAWAIQALTEALPYLPPKASQFSFDDIRQCCATLADIPGRIKALRQLITSPVNLDSKLREAQIDCIRGDILHINQPEATVELFKDLLQFCQHIDQAEVRATCLNKLLYDLARTPETVLIKLLPVAMSQLRCHEGPIRGVWDSLQPLARAVADISDGEVRTKCCKHMILALLGRSTRLRDPRDQITWLLDLGQLMASNRRLYNEWREECLQHLSEQPSEVQTALTGHFDLR